MPHAFDAGYVDEPFASLCRDYPGVDVYPPDDFRVEWGPIFHRGRLDGSARVLVLGQDPGAHEAIVRRILVGEAGQRVQGFLAKLGIESSYVMVNAFLYSVYGQGGGQAHEDDPAIAAYRHRWLDALLVGTGIEAVVAFGGLARTAFRTWQATPAGQAVAVAFEPVIHPTYPESSAKGNPAKRAEAMARMLAGWNEALARLAPAIHHPDVARELVPYGTGLTDEDVKPIPEADLPVGLPAWMRSVESWAVRTGGPDDDAREKRATLMVRVPRRYWSW